MPHIDVLGSSAVAEVQLTLNPLTALVRRPTLDGVSTLRPTTITLRVQNENQGVWTGSGRRECRRLAIRPGEVYTLGSQRASQHCCGIQVDEDRTPTIGSGSSHPRTALDIPEVTAS